MTFRSDHDALLAQTEALRRDLEDAEARLAAAADDDEQIAELRNQVERLREENNRLRVEVESEPVEPVAPAIPVTAEPVEPPPRPAPGAGSLMRPLIDTTPTGKPDRTGFLYVAFIALVLAGFIALGLSFL